MKNITNNIKEYSLKNPKIIVIFAVFILGVISYFTFSNKVHEYSFSSMGTLVTIKIAEKDINPKAIIEIKNAFYMVEDAFSGNIDVSTPAVRDVLAYNMKVYKETNGKFSPFLGSVIKLWKFDDYKKQISKIPSKKEIQQAMQKGKLNLYASAKGLAIDEASQILQKYEAKNFLINAGGDILVKGTNYGTPWKIGLKNSKQHISCKKDQYSIATSSNLYNSYVINGKKYGHLIDGQTGWPVMAEKSVSVIATNATTADTYATAFFIDETLKDKKKDLIFIKQENNKIKVYNMPEDCSIK